MGLFDNLFLDQNTPVTINDGNDHSKDNITELVDPNQSGPLPGKTASATGGNPQDDTKKGDTTKNDPKKDESISDLFDSDKKEETDAEVTLHPEPPKDIALEIGMAPADPSMSEPSFDIGGDISFESLPETTVTIGESTTASEPAGEIPTLSITDSLTLPQSDNFLTPVGTPTTPPGNDQIAQENLGSGNPSPIAAPVSETGGIFGLLGGDTQNPPPASVPEGAMPPANASASNISLIGETPPPALSGFALGQTSSPDESLPKPIASLGGSTALGGGFGNIENLSAESILGRDALALFRQGGQTSTLLREKLSSFIEELKVLHSRDQSQRYHKLEQIAMYEERIREIDAEAATRKRVLQAEIDDLKRQIEMMDREKNDIQGVISTFSKEVGI